jgi:hypothetical protein
MLLVIHDCVILLTCSNLVENGKNPQKYIQYSPEAVDQLLGQFFQGQQWAEQKRWAQRDTERVQPATSNHQPGSSVQHK